MALLASRDLTGLFFRPRPGSDIDMTSDIDIYRTASVLIREHGEEADFVAAQRADSFLDAGDMDGLAAWKRVLAAIKEIQREEPREGEVVN